MDLDFNATLIIHNLINGDVVTFDLPTSDSMAHVLLKIPQS